MPVVYDAFISYSHAKDKPVAAALQSVIQKLGKPWYRRRGLRVFRDDTSLSATPHLWPSIEKALSQSRYLILLTSPEAAASPWVGKEIEYWLANKSPETLLIGCTDGELTWDHKTGDFDWAADTPLPGPLKGKFPAEPKWVDLSAFRHEADPDNARFIELGADFAAAIHGLPKEDLLSQEVRQQRRALTLAISAAVLLFVLAIGAVTAGVIARYQQERAERNFAAAKDTVNGLIFQIAQGLRDVEGIRVESLDKILGQARDTVERLTKTDPDNPELVRSRIAMLDEFAQTYLAAGNLEAAQKNAEAALDLARRSVDKNINDQHAQRRLSVVLVHLGDVKRDMGDSAAALGAYRESLKIRETLAVDDPSNPMLQLDVSVNLERIGDLDAQTGNRAAALDDYEKSLAIRRRLAESDTDTLEWTRHVPVTLGKICDLKRDTGDARNALEACDEALAIDRRLASSDEGNTEWRRGVALSLERSGHLRLQSNDTEGALRVFEESAEMRRRLARLDPANATWQRDVASMSSLVGQAKQALGEKKAALAAQEEALQILRRLAESDPNNSILLEDIAITLDRLGYAKIALGDVGGAREAWEARVKIARHVSSLDPENLVWQRGVALALNTIGTLQQAGGNNPGALAVYTESLEIFRKVAKSDPDNIMAQPDINVVLQKIGAIRLNDGDRDGALAAYREALQIAQDMAQAFPENDVWRDDIAQTRSKIGEIESMSADDAQR